MMNGIWVFIVLAAVVAGSLNGNLDAVAKASVESAQSAVTLAIGLVGVMAFWLGMMKVLEEGGLLALLARALRPMLRRLFPEVPHDHPAMSMMVMNIGANMLGLSNAATPFGLKAMTELDRLNPHKGTATNAMALFLAINTAGITLLPTTILALRVSLGSAAPGTIFITTLISSTIGTIAAVIAALSLQKLSFFKLPGGRIAPKQEKLSAAEEAEKRDLVEGKPSTRRRVFGWATTLFVVVAFGVALSRKAAVIGPDGLAAGWRSALNAAITEWLLVVLIAAVTLFGLVRRVKVYDALVSAGKEAFEVAVRIIPFLVAILVAVGMLRASGAIDLFTRVLNPLTGLIGMPAELLPMAFLRSLTGSGSLGVATELMKAHGPDSLIGQMASTMFGSSETTFYVLAVYFGAIQVKNGRHTLAACLIADAVAVFATVWICRLLF